MFTAVGRTGIGHDDADTAFRNVQGVSYFAADGERTLRAGPDGHFIVAPLGDGGTRFEGGVGDVGDRVGSFEFVGSVREASRDGALFLLFAVGVGFGRSVLFEVG